MIISADIDNFIFCAIIDYPVKGCIYVRYPNILPRELSNCLSLKQVHLPSKRLLNISGLSSCLSLAKINLCNNYIVDISALSKCPSLTEIYLHNNQIKDVSPLLKCKNLKCSEVTCNNIESKIQFNTDIRVYY